MFSSYDGVKMVVEVEAEKERSATRLLATLGPSELKRPAAVHLLSAVEPMEKGSGEL